MALTSAPAQFFYTTASKLGDLGIVNGQIIFTSDTKTIYLDMKGHRNSYSTIQVFATDEERLKELAPIEGYYFVEDTNVLWRYKTAWRQITPSNLEPIVFFDNENQFPVVGNGSLLYCTDGAIYNWKQSSYNMIANKTEWESI